MNKYLYLACESGRILRFDTKNGKHDIVFEHPSKQTMMGLAFEDDNLYFGGKTFLGIAETKDNKFIIKKIRDYYNPYWGRLKKGFWFRVGSYSRHLKYREPQFHQMNIYNGSIFVSATDCNEVWELDRELNLLRRIIVQPHLPNYNHLNNVYFDGHHFYVCLMKYGKQFGYGGYAKFNTEWDEIERKNLGWEAHAFSLINGKMYNLCASAGLRQKIYHPHSAGLMLDGEFVFEHDPDKYYCKDFSMDEEHIYIVGGEVKNRNQRKASDGIIFVLNRQFELLQEYIIPSIGGICGCRLPYLDYTNGYFAKTSN